MTNILSLILTAHRYDTEYVDEEVDEALEEDDGFYDTTDHDTYDSQVSLIS